MTELFKNEYFKLMLEGINVWISVEELGFDIKHFTTVSNLIPRLKLTNFAHLTKALNLEIKEPVIVGVYRHKIELSVSNDALQAYLTVLVTDGEYALDKDKITTEMIDVLKLGNIQHGIMTEVFHKPIPLCQKFLVAQGDQPQEGIDAVVRYYEVSDPKPRILQDGKVNHYELNLIDNIHVGDWLGEKKPAKEGIPGLNVYGEEIPARNGRDAKLRYDLKTVNRTIQPDGTEQLYALMDGAVRIIDGKIGVDNHLLIHGDVDYNTGNIAFDGFVTIKGIVQDGFSVIAQNDITIEGNMGIGAVTKIKSVKGSIFIKGGVNGKNVAHIDAANNVFLKYANECLVTAGNTINIGFYSMDSTLKAKKVVINPEQGRVIGGRIEAAHQIIAGTIGNKSERRTEINVQGFERCAVKDELDAAAILYKDLSSKVNNIKRQLEVFENHLHQLDDKALNTYKGMKISHEHSMDELFRLQLRIEQLQEVLKTRGDGEVQISQSAYPRTFLEIKRFQKHITDALSGSFYVKDNDMLFES